MHLWIFFGCFFCFSCLLCGISEFSSWRTASTIVEYHSSVAMVSKMGSNGGIMIDYTRSKAYKCMMSPTLLLGKKVSRNILLVPQPRNGGPDVTGALHAIPICGISYSDSDLLELISLRFAISRGGQLNLAFLAVLKHPLLSILG